MLFRKMKLNDVSGVMKVATALPQWFTEGGLASIKKDIYFQSGIVAEKENQIIGFLTFFVNQGVATIGWMGVLPNHHRSGIGFKLITELRSILTNHEIRTIEVGTLGDSVDYEPYHRTRAFYRKNGFVDFAKIQHPNNPEQEEELILRSQN